MVAVVLCEAGPGEGRDNLKPIITINNIVKSSYILN
jgi:hypothetical protein